MTTVFIGVGGNLSLGPRVGPRETCLRALDLLEARDALRLRVLSPWYATAPVPASDQPWFQNAVAVAETLLDPSALLAALHAAETALGRIRTARNAARTVDLDLLLYGGLVRSDPAPIVPHPRLAERAFVLVPLRDAMTRLDARFAQDWRHPVSGHGIDELIDRLPPDQAIQRAE